MLFLSGLGLSVAPQVFGLSLIGTAAQLMGIGVLMGFVSCPRTRCVP
ncbi:hypothetical protein G4H71_14450 [Rhodococcus triatomae]|uniref:Uncharacterized protein n=1 Tax=Rhodococcus triatomae TaxID=300028 RepID=A0A1G8NJD9_9NOCA|nr:hypothetical protein [Rhodococcus triatomae]QNG20018.1 hypothetical protein G4H72_15925 [Rhodococcus triatomae]QNG24066.1 hypothetical protein G4H71_14450 [Rhodococcus triatomae]SDI80262.1 hypothetical protein SAMN05444695_11186 [Rhodococcus triatomae]